MDLDIMRNEMKQGAEKILVGDTFSNLLAFRRIYDETIIKLTNCSRQRLQELKRKMI